MRVQPIKQLSIGLKKTGGRNHTGHITAYHRGGGHKRKYRLIDWERNLQNLVAKVIRLEYDPNRSAKIALVCYTNGILSYILAPDGLKINDKVVSGFSVPTTVGNTLPLMNIPVGSFIHNIELIPGKGGQLVRSAGTSAQIIKKTENNYILVRLNSSEERLFHGYCRATIGTVSNLDHKLKKLKKAGQARWLNRRPTVRGVAMNPVDHPHGGRTNGGRPSVTPWGKLTKGLKTRKKSKQNKLIINKKK